MRFLESIPYLQIAARPELSRGTSQRCPEAPAVSSVPDRHQSARRRGGSYFRLLRHPTAEHPTAVASLRILCRRAVGRAKEQPEPRRKMYPPAASRSNAHDICQGYKNASALQVTRGTAVGANRTASQEKLIKIGIGVVGGAQEKAGITDGADCRSHPSTPSVMC